MFGLNAGKYGQEKSPYLDTFRTVRDIGNKATNKMTKKKLLVMIVPVDHEEAKNLKQTQSKEKKNRKRI